MLKGTQSPVRGYWPGGRRADNRNCKNALGAARKLTKAYFEGFANFPAFHCLVRIFFGDCRNKPGLYIPPPTSLREVRDEVDFASALAIGQFFRRDRPWMQARVGCTISSRNLPVFVLLDGVGLTPVEEVGQLGEGNDGRLTRLGCAGIYIPNVSGPRQIHFPWY